ncbi:MAG: DUF4238 domain-containing protein [Thermodesulfobacteriota bacterium]
MPESKKHHYVPRFYLKRFSENKRSISLYNLKNELIVPHASIRDQCYREYFYGKEPFVESAFADIENAVSYVLRQVDEIGSLPPPDHPHYLLLIVYIVTQCSRTKYSADSLNEMTDKMMKHVYRPMAEEQGLEIDKFNIHLNDAVNLSLAQSVLIYPVLFDLRYKLLINSTDEQFVTSDHPVALYNQLMEFQTRSSHTGYACKGLQIFFPIDPKKLIFLYDNEVYRAGNDKQSVVEINTVQDIYQINTLQVCSCQENIYFLNSDMNCEALHNKAKPYLSDKMVDFNTFPIVSNKLPNKEIIKTSREDIRTNLKLSFLSIRKSAKNWRNKFRKLKSQPAVVVRNKEICDDTEEFIQSVKDGNYKPEEFFKYWYDKYGDK